VKSRVLFVNFIFGAAFTSLLLLSWLSYRRIVQHVRFSNAVLHTNVVLMASEQLISSLKDVETGQRGFLLTRDSTFLEPYFQGQKKTAAAYDTLRFLTSDNALQQYHLDTLQTRISRRNVVARMALQNPAGRERLLREGKVEMDATRALVEQVQAEEKRLLKIRTDAKDENEQYVPLFLGLLAITGLGLLTLFFVLTQRELSKRTRVQAELEQKVESLNRSNAELEQFAYVASHDLQEPIRKIRSFSERLTMKYKNELSPEAGQILERINASAIRMHTLIDDLLQFSRLVNKEEPFSAVNLNDVFRGLREDMSEVIKNKKGEMFLKNLPIVVAYPTQMRQIFHNLLSNSLKYAKPDVPPQVFVQGNMVKGYQIQGVKDRDREREFHRIALEDNGIGFDEKYLDKIFIIFQRLHNRAEYGGTGIGLAICKRVVANHGGYLEAKSRLGEGATFIVYLPTEQI
jgi:signal transduction histidine kinase